VSLLAVIGTGAVLTALVLSTTAPRAAAPYADGAPPGFSGGFKEQSCHACHFEAEPNTKPGEVTLTGVPERFVAEQKYPLTVTLSRPGMIIGGFQLAARFEDGTQSGTLERGPGEDGRLAIEVQSNVHYANQKRKGAEPTTPGTAKWTVVWTAPAGRMPVTFNVAANAADKDESARGDYIYTAAVQTRPQ
jgi:hypothetical protein